jgi:hypothetical protein
MRLRSTLQLGLLIAAAPLALSQTTLYGIDGLTEDEIFANAVIALGDQNGDGRGDYGVLVVNREITQGPSQGRRGVIEVRSGVSGDLIRTLENPMAQTSRTYFDAVAIADSDQDGNTDILVTWVVGLAAEVGIVRISSATGAIIDEVQPPANRVISLYGMNPIHDLDGDGVADFALSLGNPFSGSVAGNGVALYSGSELALLQLLEPANRHFAYGWDVDSTGDLDGDGTLDLAVSSSGDDSNGLRAGAVYLHSGATGAVIDVLFGTAPEERFGFAVERLPDIDMDGVEDLAISSNFLLDPLAYGRVALISGATRTTIREIISPVMNDSFGWDLALVGDQDADGMPDLAIGAPNYRAAPGSFGRVEVHSIVSELQVAELEAEREGQAFGKTILPLSDVQPNGYQEILVAGDGLVTSGGFRVGGLSVFDGPMVPDCVPSIPYCGQVVPNSTGMLATLTQAGDADLSGSLFRLFGNDLPIGSNVLLLTSLETGFASQPGGSAGNLCLGGAIGRFTSIIQQTGPSGRVVFRPDLAQMPTPLGHVQADFTQIWHFQAWYRDMDASGVMGSNFTSALSVDVCP